MSFEVKDLLGLDKPMTKLVEVVSAGFGTLYRPRAIRNEADAEAYKMVALAKAKAEGERASLEIELASAIKRIEDIAPFEPDLAARAKQRLLVRELEGQANIENIVEHATLELPSDVSENPVSDDWRRKFFLEAENICDTDMQRLWGKVLAGEVANPGSFSIRALNTLRNLSQYEAELFRRFCAIAMVDGWIVKPGDMNTAFIPFGIDYSSIMRIRDIGLLASGDDLHRRFPFRAGIHGATGSVMLVNNGVYIQLSGGVVGGPQIPSMFLTGVGQELQRLIENAPNMEYLKSLGMFFRGYGGQAKIGKLMPQDDGSSIITFEEDL